MLAPQRVFTFNPALSHNDGVLASSIARAEGLSYAQASQILDAELPAMRRALEEDSRLSLGRIGTLMRNADGSMRFVAAPAIEMTPSFMWLPTVDLAGFAEVEEVAAPAAAVARAGMRPRRVLGRVARMAAALSLFVAVGLALLHPRAIENPQQASLGVEMPKAQVASDIIEMPSEAKAPVILVLRNEADAATAVDTAAYAARRAEVKASAAAAKRYCLVVASLGSEPEARRFVDSNKDVNLGILVKDGRYRVYAAEGSSIADVSRKAAESELSARFPSSWVCRK